MLLPELVPLRSWMRPALQRWEQPAWQLVRSGAWRPRALSPSEARAQLERVLVCSLVVVRRRHEAIIGPLLGFQASEALQHLVLVEASSLSAESPWEGEALESTLQWGLEADLHRAAHERPGWSLRLPPELETLLKPR